jgi:hypothetical protein
MNPIERLIRELTQQVGGMPRGTGRALERLQRLTRGPYHPRRYQQLAQAIANRFQRHGVWNTLARLGRYGRFARAARPFQLLARVLGRGAALRGIPAAAWRALGPLIRMLPSLGAAAGLGLLLVLVLAIGLSIYLTSGSASAARTVATCDCRNQHAGLLEGPYEAQCIGAELEVKHALDHGGVAALGLTVENGRISRGEVLCDVVAHGDLAWPVEGAKGPPQSGVRFSRSPICRQRTGLVQACKGYK